MNAHLSDRLSTQFALEAETIILTEDISTSAARLNDIRAPTENDEDIQELIVVIRAEWPVHKLDASNRTLPWES